MGELEWGESETKIGERHQREERGMAGQAEIEVDRARPPLRVQACRDRSRDP